MRRLSEARCGVVGKPRKKTAGSQLGASHRLGSMEHGAPHRGHGGNATVNTLSTGFPGPAPALRPCRVDTAPSASRTFIMAGRVIPAMVGPAGREQPTDVADGKGDVVE